MSWKIIGAEEQFELNQSANQTGPDWTSLTVRSSLVQSGSAWSNMDLWLGSSVQNHCFVTKTTATTIKNSVNSVKQQPVRTVRLLLRGSGEAAALHRHRLLRQTQLSGSVCSVQNRRNQRLITTAHLCTFRCPSHLDH